MSRKHEFSRFGVQSLHIRASSVWLGYIWFFLSVLTACSQSSSSPTATPIDQSTPEATIRTLYNAISQSNLQMLQAVLAPNDTWNEAAIRGFRHVWENDNSFEITDLVIDIVAVEHGRVRARTRYYETVNVNGRVDLERESGSLLTLKLIGDRWYFIGLGQQPSPPGWAQEEPSFTPAAP